MALLSDLWFILVSDWSPGEQTFLFGFFVLVVLPVIGEIRDRWAE